MENATALQIHVELVDVKPPIWRRLLVPADTTLDQLHLLLQGAFGWTDSHLHGFRQGDRRFTVDPESFENAEEESDVTLDELLGKKKATLIYDYDFGDDWEHTIRLEKRVSLTAEQLADLPRLLDGARACPPEDCGGVFGYQQFLKHMKAKDPETMEWFSSLNDDDDGDDDDDGGGGGEWSSEAFDREKHEADMQELGVHRYTNTPAWTPLEEQLAWAKLDSFMSQPEWKLTWEVAEEAMRASDSMTALGAPSSKDGIPGFEELVRDHAAFDLIFEDTEPVVPELIRTHPDLPEGAQAFLRTMFLEPLSPYLVERECTGGQIGLFCLMDKEVFDVESRPDCENLQEGNLLLARVISNGEHNLIRGQWLQSPFNVESFEDLLPHLQMMCKLDGGDPTDMRQLLKSAPPLLLTFWKAMMSDQSPDILPLTAYRNAEWEPGTSVLIGFEEFMAQSADALNRNRNLLLVSKSLWMFADPDADPQATPPLGLPGFPIAWIMLVPGQLHMLAGSRKALKLCRDSLKKIGLPPMRHFKTRYGEDLNLPVAPIQ